MYAARSRLRLPKLQLSKCTTDTHLLDEASAWQLSKLKKTELIQLHLRIASRSGSNDADDLSDADDVDPEHWTKQDLIDSIVRARAHALEPHEASPASAYDDSRDDTYVDRSLDRDDDDEEQGQASGSTSPLQTRRRASAQRARQIGSTEAESAATRRRPSATATAPAAAEAGPSRSRSSSYLLRRQQNAALRELADDESDEEDAAAAAAAATAAAKEDEAAYSDTDGDDAGGEETEAEGARRKRQLDRRKRAAEREGGRPRAAKQRILGPSPERRARGAAKSSLYALGQQRGRRSQASLCSSTTALGTPKRGAAGNLRRIRKGGAKPSVLFAATSPVKSPVKTRARLRARIAGDGPTTARSGLAALRSEDDSWSEADDQEMMEAGSGSEDDVDMQGDSSAAQQRRPVRKAKAAAQQQLGLGRRGPKIARERSGSYDAASETLTASDSDSDNSDADEDDDDDFVSVRTASSALSTAPSSRPRDNGPFRRTRSMSRSTSDLHASSPRHMHGSEAESVYMDAEDDEVVASPSKVRRLRSGKLLIHRESSTEAASQLRTAHDDEEEEEDDDDADTTIADQTIVPADSTDVEMDDGSSSELTQSDEEGRGDDDVHESVLVDATTTSLSRLRKGQLLALCGKRGLNADEALLKADLVRMLIGLVSLASPHSLDAADETDAHPSQAEPRPGKASSGISASSAITAKVSSASSDLSSAPARSRQATPLLLRSTEKEVQDPQPDTPPVQEPQSSEAVDELNGLDLESLNLLDKEIAPNKLEKMEKIGSGGFKDVYVGKYKVSKSRSMKVAIADIRDQLTEMDIKELSLLRDLKHENIVRFIGVSIPAEPRSVPCMIVSELCSNGDLFDYIRNVPVPSDAEVVSALSPRAL